jgi:hypothetical protein
MFKLKVLYDNLISSHKFVDEEIKIKQNKILPKI